MTVWPWLLLPGAALAGAVLTGAVTRHLRQRAILDHPNERSSHTVPTPRGGGWGILAVLLPAWAALGVTPWVLAAVALLAAVSWLDDRHDLPPVPRLLVQAAVVGLGLIALGDEARVFQGWLPGWLDHLLTGLCWLWCINLFNFMDGSDGLAGSEAAAVAGGVALVAAAGSSDGAAMAPALVLTGAALGFLVWNWSPAKVFMGDVGSIPLGFALGWLLFGTAAAGLWMAALLLPLYFVTDASLTLLRRLLAGKPVLQAHREHFYQRAIQGGRSHAAVARLVIAANAVLIALALAAPTVGRPVLAGGALTVLALILRLRGTEGV